MTDQLLFLACAALFSTFRTEDWRAGCRPAFEGDDILFGLRLKDGSWGWYERRSHSEHSGDPVFQLVRLLLNVRHDRQNNQIFGVPLDSLVITKSMVEQIVGHEISDDEWDGFTELREDEVAEFAAGVWQQLAADREEFALEQAELEQHGG